MAGSAGGDLRARARSVWAPALGVAVLVAVALAGSSVRTAVERDASARVAGIDEVVRTANPLAAFDAIRRAELPHVGRATLFESAPALVKALDGRNAPDAHVVTYDGVTTNGARVNSDLARKLHAHAGDKLVIDTGGRIGTVVISEIVPSRGLDAYAPDASARGANVVVSPKILAAMKVHGTALIAITNIGGAGATDDAVAELTHVRGAGNIAVEGVSRDVRSDARHDARARIQPLTAAGAIAIGAWIVLLAIAFARRRIDVRAAGAGVGAGLFGGMLLAVPIVRAVRVPLSFAGAAIPLLVCLAFAIVVIGALGLFAPRLERLAPARISVPLRLAVVAAAILMPALLNVTSPYVFVVQAAIVGVVATRSRVSAAVCMVVFALAVTALDTAPLANAQRPSFGGWDVIGSAPATRPLPADTIATLVGDEAVAPLASTTVRVGTDTGTVFTRVGLTSFDENLLQRPPPALLHRNGFANDRAVYDAVLHQPDLVVVSDALFERVAGRTSHRVAPGDHLRIGGRRVTVAATTSIDTAMLGVLTSTTTARELTGASAAFNGFLLAAGADRAEIAASDINASLWESGISTAPVAAVTRTESHRLAAPAHAIELIELLGLVAACAAIVLSTERPVRRALIAAGSAALIAVVAAFVDHAAVRPDLPWRLPNFPGAGLLVAAVIAMVLATLAARERQPETQFARAMPPSQDADGFGVRTNVPRSTATSPNFGS